jgi:superfamily II DNA/RNA helicase
MSELIRREDQHEYEVEEFGTFLDEHWGEEENGSSFDSMELKKELLRGIYSSGLERPNLIQQVNWSSVYYLASSQTMNCRK